MHPLELRPSRVLTILVGMAHLLSVLLTLWLPLHALITAALVLTIAGSCYFHLRRDCLLASPEAILGLHLDKECNAALRFRDQNWTDATLLPGSLVTPWLCVLNFRLESGRCRYLVILPDALPTDIFRRLRVLLRWKCDAKLAGKAGNDPV